MIICPNLQSEPKRPAEDKLFATAYSSPAGSIKPLEGFYGFNPATASNNLFMAHHVAFTRKLLSGTQQAAGFKSVGIIASGLTPFLDLWSLACKKECTDAKLRALADEHVAR